jgi:thiol:disulfide interchange protein DsbC
MRKILLGLCLWLGTAGLLQAAEPVAVPAALKAKLEEMLPGGVPDGIRPAAVPGLWEVSIGLNVVYFSADGRYLLRGELLDVDSGENLTEVAVRGKRLEVIQALGEEGMIVYAPEKETRHTVTVFTDVDCGYCRKLHEGMAEMNRLGIKVRYLAFPRAGIGSPTFQKMAAIWCAKDQRKAMDTAKAGQPLAGADATCDHPIAEHLALVRALGLTGTPALVFEDGRLVPGYMPPDRLLALLEEGRPEGKVAGKAKGGGALPQ